MMSEASAGPERRLIRRKLFAIGFLVMFMELACIRWFGAYVVFLQFFSNVVLIAAFLGMSIGCASASSTRPDWMGLFPALAATAILAAAALFTTYQLFPHLAIDVGTQAPGSSLIFFGTEYRNIDLANFVIPMELVCGFFFVLVLAMFIGPGQILGRCFLSDPDRVRAYAANIAGAVLGRFAEYLSMLLRFQVLVLVALAFYALSSMGRMGGAVR